MKSDAAAASGDVVTLVLDAKGRAAVPASMRADLGWQPGQLVVAHVEAHRLIIETRETSLAAVHDRISSLLGRPSTTDASQTMRQERERDRQVSDAAFARRSTSPSETAESAARGRALLAALGID